MKKIGLFICRILVLSIVAVAAAPVISSSISSSFNANAEDPVDPDIANDNALTDTMCNVLNIVTGNAGKAFAAFAIISVGIGFFTGKVSWGLMIGVAMGIAAMFGAPTIVAAISGKGSFDCSQ